jgi:hypothetical protein
MSLVRRQPWRKDFFQNAIHASSAWVWTGCCDLHLDRSNEMEATEHWVVGLAGLLGILLSWSAHTALELSSSSFWRGGVLPSSNSHHHRVQTFHASHRPK